MGWVQCQCLKKCTHTLVLQLSLIDLRCLHLSTKCHTATYMRQSHPTLLSPNVRQFACQYLNCFAGHALHECHESFVAPSQRNFLHAVDSVLELRLHNNSNHLRILYAKHCTPAGKKIDLVIQLIAIVNSTSGSKCIES